MKNSEFKNQLATTSPLLGEVVNNLQARITEQPAYTSWEYPAEFGGGLGSISQEGIVNYDGLNDHEKMVLYIFAWNLSDICPGKKSIMKQFEWSEKKVTKMYKELKAYGLECVATFSENTGLLCGRGYRWE